VPRRRYAMKVIPEPPGNTTVVEPLDFESVDPEDPEYVCGNCTHTLINAAPYVRVRDVVMRCRGARPTTRSIRQVSRCAPPH
jgi:hypothetical protein